LIATIGSRWRDAERGKLTALAAHEVYNRALPRPSIQESTEATAQEPLPWIEGREQEARDIVPQLSTGRRRGDGPRGVQEGAGTLLEVR